MSFSKRSDGAAWLAGVAFFEGFTTEELERVAGLCSEIQVDAGTVLVDQGDPAMDCFVVGKGTASVYVGGEHIASIGPAGMIGEMALVDYRPRSATVVADTPMDLVRFEAKAFRTLLDEMPKASERVLTMLTARLAELSRRG